MPIACNKDATVPVWLKNDEQIPENERPTFYCRFLSSRQRQDIDDRLSALRELEDNAKVEAGLAEVFKLCIKRWERLKDERDNPVPFSPDSYGVLIGILTPYEQGELLRLARTEPMAKERDFFSSASPSPCAPAQSAPAAESVQTASVPAPESPTA